MKHSIEGKYKIKYVWIGIFFLFLFCTVLFIILYVCAIEFKLLDVVATVTGITATLTLIYHSFSFEYQIKTQNENNNLFRAKYTYDLISEWTKPQMMDSISVTREILKNPERIAELNDVSKIELFEKFLNANLDKRAHLVLILNYFENISTMIETEHIDIDIVKKAFKSLFTSYYKTLKHYIDYRQKEYPDSWMYFEKISTKWIAENRLA